MRGDRKSIPNRFASVCKDVRDDKVNHLRGKDVARFFIRVQRDKNKRNYIYLLCVLCTIRLIMYTVLIWNTHVELPDGVRGKNLFLISWDISLFLILS